jgi:putative FmdB family regulatory protein
MPLYDFRCRRCSHEFETLVRGQEPAVCPACHSDDVERLLAAFAVRSAERTEAAARRARRRAAAIARRENIAREEELARHRHYGD